MTSLCYNLPISNSPLEVLSFCQFIISNNADNLQSCDKRLHCRPISSQATQTTRYEVRDNWGLGDRCKTKTYIESNGFTYGTGYVDQGCDSKYQWRIQRAPPSGLFYRKSTIGTTKAAIEANNGTYCLRKRIEKFPLPKGPDSFILTYKILDNSNILSKV